MIQKSADYCVPPWGRVNGRVKAAQVLGVLEMTGLDQCETECRQIGSQRARVVRPCRRENVVARAGRGEIEITRFIDMDVKR